LVSHVAVVCEGFRKANADLIGEVAHLSRAAPQTSTELLSAEIAETTQETDALLAEAAQIDAELEAARAEARSLQETLEDAQARAAGPPLEPELEPDTRQWMGRLESCFDEPVPEVLSVLDRIQVVNAQNLKLRVSWQRARIRKLFGQSSETATPRMTRE
jgi:multidrug efflux pump subunit AcrA (membrane-fusion protein)